MELEGNDKNETEWKKNGTNTDRTTITSTSESKPKKNTLKKQSHSNGTAESHMNGTEGGESTGAKVKTLKKKTKKPSTKGKSGDSSEMKVDDKLPESEEGSSKMTSVDSVDQLGKSNGVGNDDSSSLLTNGHLSSNTFHSQTPNNSGDEAAPKQKKKKLRRKAPVFEKSDVLCEGCDCYVDRNTLREYRSVVSFTMQRLKDMKEDNPSILYCLI